MRTGEPRGRGNQPRFHGSVRRAHTRILQRTLFMVEGYTKGQESRSKKILARVKGHAAIAAAGYRGVDMLGNILRFRMRAASHARHFRGHAAHGPVRWRIYLEHLWDTVSLPPLPMYTVPRLSVSYGQKSG